MASYAGRIAPPGYPKTTFTPSRTRHSQRICAPVSVILLIAFTQKDQPQSSQRPQSYLGKGIPHRVLCELCVLCGESLSRHCPSRSRRNQPGVLGEDTGLV